eukprot:1604332-Amphidinium_carterae.1
MVLELLKNVSKDIKGETAVCEDNISSVSVRFPFLTRVGVISLMLLDQQKNAPKWRKQQKWETHVCEENSFTLRARFLPYLSEGVRGGLRLIFGGYLQQGESCVNSSQTWSRRRPRTS